MENTVSEYDPTYDTHDNTTDDYGHEHADHHDYGDPHAQVAVFTDGSQVGVVDYDADGYTDLLATDSDGDGTPEDVYTDERGGPALETHYSDHDESGVAERVDIDRNEDGFTDVVRLDGDEDGLTTDVVDTDLDGVFDTVHYGDPDTNPFASA